MEERQKPLYKPERFPPRFPRAPRFSHLEILHLPKCPWCSLQIYFHLYSKILIWPRAICQNQGLWRQPSLPRRCQLPTKLTSPAAQAAYLIISNIIIVALQFYRIEWLIVKRGSERDVHAFTQSQEIIYHHVRKLAISAATDIERTTWSIAIWTISPLPDFDNLVLINFQTIYSKFPFQNRKTASCLYSIWIITWTVTLKFSFSILNKYGVANTKEKRREKNTACAEANSQKCGSISLPWSFSYSPFRLRVKIGNNEAASHGRAGHSELFFLLSLIWFILLFSAVILLCLV